MDKLSIEIISLIADHLGPKHATKLAPYSTISHTWNAVIEARIFSWIRLQTHPPAQLQTFTRIFKTVRRRGFVRRLEVELCLPTHGDTRKDHTTNQTSVRAAVVCVLGELESWESKVPGSPRLGSVCLSIGPCYRLDPNMFKDGEINPHFNVKSSTAARRYLTLDLDTLPRVSCVGRLKTGSRVGQAVHPRSKFELIRCFPQIEDLELEYQDPAPKRREMRKEHHEALAHGIASLAHHCPRLRTLSLARNTSHGTAPEDDCFQLQDLTLTTTTLANSCDSKDSRSNLKADPLSPWAPHQQNEENQTTSSASITKPSMNPQPGSSTNTAINFDPLCTSLRHLAQAGTLTTMKLSNIPISPDLFRAPTPAPQSSTQPNEPPYASSSNLSQSTPPSQLLLPGGGPGACEEESNWNSMQTLEIHFPIFAPDGSWYFTGSNPPPPAAEADPNSSDDDDDELDSLAGSDASDVDSETLSDCDDDDRQRDARANGLKPTRTWRTHPDPETFNPLAVAAVEAVCLRMPRLQNFEMVTIPGPHLTPDHNVALTCAVAGKKLCPCNRRAWGKDLRRRDRYNALLRARAEDWQGKRRWKAWCGLEKFGKIKEWEIPGEIKKLCKEWVERDGGEERGQLLGLLASGDGKDWKEEMEEEEEESESGGSDEESEDDVFGFGS